jgi:hypothetical protein
VKTFSCKKKDRPGKNRWFLLKLFSKKLCGKKIIIGACWRKSPWESLPD